MRKFLILIEIEYDGFVIGYFDSEYEAKLCIENIKNEADQYEFSKLKEYSKKINKYIKKYQIPVPNRYDFNTYESSSNGTLSIYLHVLDTLNFNLDFYISNRIHGVSAIDMLDDKYEIIYDRFTDLFPNFKVMAN